MTRSVLGVFVLLLAWPVLHGDDKPPTPQARFDALLSEARQARGEYSKALQEAKKPDEQRQAMRKNRARMDRLAAKFLALAAEAPKDPVAFDALAWVAEQDVGRPEKIKAIDLLLRHQVLSDRCLTSDKIAPICQSLALRYDRASEALLRTILAKNPHQNIRTEASFALAHSLNQRLGVAKEIQRFPDDTALMERIAGKEVVEELRKKDPDVLESAVAKAWSEFADKYSADIPEERLRIACAWLRYSETNEVEAALRTLENDKRRAVQGIACLVLGQILKGRADVVADKDAKAAEKIRNESDRALNRAAGKYGDVKIMWSERNSGNLIGDQAKSELYELHHLAIGMKAPEIAGADQDGRKFKLSDYKGKVVLLDFWSQH